MDYQDALLKQDFGTLDKLIFAHAQHRPLHPALICGPEELDYSTLDLRIGRVAASLKRDHVGKGDVVAICASTSIAYAQVFLGALRAGAAVAPLAPSSTPDVLAAMLVDSGAAIVFMDAASAATLSLARTSRALAKMPIFSIVSLDGSGSGIPLDAWLAREPVESDGIEIRPEDPFNVIYSSGTTGTPKGIVQPHGMRWTQFRRLRYAADAVTIISTPLYSNTTLVCFLPTLAAGATAVLMPKFDVPEFLRLSEYHRVTHTMLVPVQYQRLMRDPSFDDYDLSSYRVKFATSAPFAVELKQEVLTRWPGGLIELYGMTEGGGSCMLEAHRYPEKLHTVGKAMDGNDIRVIDEHGVECLTGEAGEIVGRSASMMTGYRNLPDKTREAEWVSPDGLRFIRTGDIGRFDADGFLVLIDRAKDLIISGGFNIYPSDLEAVLSTHPAVDECAVVGVASAAWGETPVAFARLRDGSDVDAVSLKAFVNDRVGRTQRLSDLLLVDTLPRSAIGKILKRDLRQRYEQQSSQTASS